MVECGGRPVRRFDNRPAGRRCAATYPGSMESARVAGWRVGPADAMCPACARPGADNETDELDPTPAQTLPGL